MYLKYHTDAFVLGVTNVGEKDRIVRLLTRDVGLVHASGRSVRELKSKLRYGLQPLSLSEVSLVRGTSTWRIASATAKESVFLTLLHNHSHNAVRMFARILATIERLVRGEEKNKALYECIEQGFSFLVVTKLSPDDLFALECVLMVRTLHCLGYMDEMKYERRDPITLEILAAVHTDRKVIVTMINKALHATQL